MMTNPRPTPIHRLRARILNAATGALLICALALPALASAAERAPTPPPPPAPPVRATTAQVASVPAAVRAGQQQRKTEMPNQGDVGGAWRESPGRRPQERSQNGHGWSRISAGKTCTSRWRFDDVWGAAPDQTRLKTSDPLVPPKPKLFFTATSIFMLRAVLAQ